MDILCAGATGLHDPASGILGTSDKPITNMLCALHAEVARQSAAPAEAAIRLATVNADVLRTRMANLLDVNATYLALAAPTNTDMLAQVRRLTRECNILMRLAGNWLDTTTGT